MACLTFLDSRGRGNDGGFVGMMGVLNKTHLND